MFVVSAKQGKIKKDKDGGTMLEMDIADINRVIEFSDRPDRIVKIITGNDLVKYWTKGENSFASDPPNAVLSGANFKPHIVILNGMTITGDTITFKVDGLSSNSVSGGRIYNPVLVVDEWRAFERWADSLFPAKFYPTPIADSKLSLHYRCCLRTYCLTVSSEAGCKYPYE